LPRRLRRTKMTPPGSRPARTQSSWPFVHGIPRHPGASGADQTARRLRPWRRRRFNTARPPGDCIRLRNPCLFLRRRRLGWKVRFGIVDLDSSLAWEIRQQAGLKPRNLGFFTATVNLPSAHTTRTLVDVERLLRGWHLDDPVRDS
jgi:hypothetical protein